MKLSPHFDRTEFACACVVCGCDTVDAELLSVLEALRVHFNCACNIHAGHRCERQNEHVGGAAASLHLIGRAADFSLEFVPNVDVVAWLILTYPNRFGIGLYNFHVHLDTRGAPAYWEDLS